MTADASNNWWIRERRNAQRACQNMFQKNIINEPFMEQIILAFCWWCLNFFYTPFTYILISFVILLGA
jgi:hypothetical protein